MHKKTQLLNALFLALVFAVTCYTLFRDEELGDILFWFRQARGGVLCLALALVPAFIFGEAATIWYLLRTLRQGVPFRSCAKYSCIGFFFSCITPSASGGQPAQLVEMRRDGVSLPVGSMVLLIITIAYKLVLVTIGMGCLLFAEDWIETSMGSALPLFYLGLSLNILFITALFFLVFSNRLSSAVILRGAAVLERLHILRPNPAREERLRGAVANYQRAAAFFRGNRKVLAVVFLITFAQRVTLFFTTWVVYRSFGLSGVGLPAVLVLQASISLSVDMLPLPGGIGASEHLFLAVFDHVFGPALVLPAMLLSRGFSFYLLLLISALVTLVSHMGAPRRGAVR
ncbi:MAG TPA: lysylphosphatidylglycerol synthase transmembrane domain-containing protein [Oscillospiraceae bacterium]|nr:lysylphosphatidylglycerol synthase transmembrane domain-containing protein [Oscillospiraceae bacterium]